MQRFEGLFGQRLDEIRGKAWYRQRFDACPHFMFFLGDAHISSIQSTRYPIGQRIAFAGFSKNRADWYHGLEELERTANEIVKLSRKNPQISRDMLKEFEPWQSRFYEECARLEALGLNALSDEQLLGEYRALASTYVQKLNASPLIDGFALTTDTLLADAIRSVLKEKSLEGRFNEIFPILTAPVFNSFLQEEEIALLGIALKVKENPPLRNELLKIHQRAFFWVQNNYVKDNVLPVEYFEKRLSALEKGDVSARMSEIKELPIAHLREKRKLIGELSLPEEIRALLAITDDFNAWQDERKKGTFYATHYFSLILEEVSRRTGYSMQQLKYAFPPEMERILHKTIPKEELDRRFEYCMLLWVPGKYDMITDLELIGELDSIGTGKSTLAHEVHGFTASKGKARGTARIVESAEEISKVQNGDVIIAVMTRPDYLPAMRKAVAFVTDEGGVTCHAAIVAREMRKPCVIATKIATKLFKDGDLVEVDADSGKVRKL